MKPFTNFRYYKIPFLILFFFISLNAYAQKPVIKWSNRTSFEIKGKSVVKFSKDGKNIYIGTGNHIYELDAATGNTLRTFDSTKTKETIVGIDVSADGSSVAAIIRNTAVSSGVLAWKVNKWNIQTGKAVTLDVLKASSNLTSANAAIRFHPTLNILYFAVRGILSAYDLDKNTIVYQNNEAGILARNDAKEIIFSPDLKTMYISSLAGFMEATNSDWSEIKTFDVSNLKYIKTITSTIGDLNSFAIPKSEDSIFVIANMTKLFSLFSISTNSTNTNSYKMQGAFTPKSCSMLPGDSCLILFGGEGNSKSTTIFNLNSKNFCEFVPAGLSEGDPLNANDNKIDASIDGRYIILDSNLATLIQIEYVKTNVDDFSKSKIKLNFDATQSNLNIDNNASDIIERIEIYDYAGSLLFENNNIQNSQSVAFSFGKGVYFAVVYTDSNKYAFPILKSK